MKYTEFFQRRGDYVVNLQFYECRDQITVEDLYQMFLLRIQAETKIVGNRIMDFEGGE